MKDKSTVMKSWPTLLKGLLCALITGGMFVLIIALFRHFLSAACERGDSLVPLLALACFTWTGVAFFFCIIHFVQVYAKEVDRHPGPVLLSFFNIYPFFKSHNELSADGLDNMAIMLLCFICLFIPLFLESIALMGDWFSEYRTYQFIRQYQAAEKAAEQKETPAIPTNDKPIRKHDGR